MILALIDRFFAVAGVTTVEELILPNNAPQNALKTVDMVLDAVAASKKLQVCLYTGLSLIQRLATVQQAHFKSHSESGEAPLVWWLRQLGRLSNIEAKRNRQKSWPSNRIPLAGPLHHAFDHGDGGAFYFLHGYLQRWSHQLERRLWPLVKRKGRWDLLELLAEGMRS